MKALCRGLHASDNCGNTDRLMAFSVLVSFITNAVPLYHGSDSYNRVSHVVRHETVLSSSSNHIERGPNPALIRVQMHNTNVILSHFKHLEHYNYWLTKKSSELSFFLQSILFFFMSSAFDMQNQNHNLFNELKQHIQHKQTNIKRRGSVQK